MGAIRATVTEAINIDGAAISAQRQLTGDVAAVSTVTAPAATAGTVTTWTDANTGEVTAAGHDITTGDKVGVFWLNGTTRERRVNMTATVTGDVVAVDGGSGNDLPDQDTVVTIARMVEIEVACHPAGVVGWWMGLDQDGTALTLDFDGGADETIDLTADEAYQFIAAQHTSAFSTTSGWLYVATSATSDATFKSAFLGDAE